MAANSGAGPPDFAEVGLREFAEVARDADLTGLATFAGLTTFAALAGLVALTGLATFAALTGFAAFAAFGVFATLDLDEANGFGLASLVALGFAARLGAGLGLDLAERTGVAFDAATVALDRDFKNGWAAVWTAFG